MMTNLAGKAIIDTHPASPQECDYVLKCIFIGEPCAGKSSVLAALVNDKFDPRRETTIGIDFRTMSATGYNDSDVNGQVKQKDVLKYKLQLWDCAGQIRFRSIVSSYYRLAHVVFVVFDLTDRGSFEAVKPWVEDVKRNVDGKYALVLIGNKSDLIANKLITDREIWKMVSELGFDAYTPTSALTRENVRDAINVGITRAHQMHMRGDIKLQATTAVTTISTLPTTGCCVLM